MATWEQISNKIKKIDLEKEARYVFTQLNLEKWAVEKIQKRLYDKGETGSFIKLKTDKGEPYYTLKYQTKKRKIGEKTSNVTLFLSGGFYRSIKLEMQNNGFKIDTDFKYLAVHFKNIYASEADAYKDILSLTQKEIKEIVIDKAIPLLIKRLL